MVYDPPALEVFLTLALGKTIAAPFYRRYVDNLPLAGNECMLDFGSGSGVCSRFLAARLAKGGGRLTCVDVSQRWLDIARKTLRKYPNVEYRLGALATLGLAEASYDAVFVHFVLHDIAVGERSGVVAQLSRILRQGGCVYLHEPLGRGLTPDEARALMQTAGLREVSSRLAQSRLAGPTYQAIFERIA